METGNLIRLIYYSELELSMSESDLDNIINQSRQNNRENEVTGILFFSGTDFIQVLEGPESVVIKLYATIMNDSRHKNCELLDIGFGQNRFFSEWAMGYVPQVRADLDKLKSMLSNHQKRHRQSLSEVTGLLKTYLRKVV